MDFSWLSLSGMVALKIGLSGSKSSGIIRGGAAEHIKEYIANLELISNDYSVFLFEFLGELKEGFLIEREKLSKLGFSIVNCYQVVWLLNVMMYVVMLE